MTRGMPARPNRGEWVTRPSHGAHRQGSGPSAGRKRTYPAGRATFPVSRPVDQDVTTTTRTGAEPMRGPTNGPTTGGAAVDHASFDDFVTGRSTGLLRTAYLLTHDRALAEDLVQTALSKAWFAWGRIEGRPEAYVRRIMVNTYSSWWRRRWNGEEATADLPERGAGQGFRPGEDVRVDDRTDLWRALARLPRRQRAVVVLRFYEDLSEAETADIMQCSVGTVKSQASRALAKLRVDPTLQTSDEERVR